MKVKITYFVKGGKGTVYVDGKPQTDSREVELPLKFAYGSYNEPKKVIKNGSAICDVDDVISIEPA